MIQKNSNIPNNIFPEDLLLDSRKTFSHARFSPVLLNLQQMQESDLPYQQLHSLLTDSEQSKFSTFTLRKRRLDWLGGRACAKLALMRFFGDEFSLDPLDIGIDNHSSGRPFAVFSAGRPPGMIDISISHSANIACALASNSFCGIDLQAPRETLLRVQERFCSEDDEKKLQQATDITTSLDYLTLLWAAKEAVRKAYSHRLIPEFLHIQLHDIKALDYSYRFLFYYNTEKIAVTCGFHMNYGLAICIIQD